MAFMDSIDSIREKATEAAQVAAKKTKKLAEIAKANLSIYQEEDKIKKAQTELGKLYYRDYVVGEEMDSAEYLPWCQKIDESKQTIADLRDYIDELKAEQVVEEDQEAVEEVPDEEVPVEEAPAEEAAPEIEVVVCDEPEEPKPEEPEEPKAEE
ncbi:MAG: serine proteinase [Candidatus Avoscillospira sp.]